MTIILHIILTVSEKYVNSAVLLFGLFTAARNWPESERPTTDTPERPNSVSWGMIFLYCGLGLKAAVVIVWFLHHLHLFTVHCPVEDLRKVTSQQDHCEQFDQRSRRLTHP